jgi:hypothetical protein
VRVSIVPFGTRNPAEMQTRRCHAELLSIAPCRGKGLRSRRKIRTKVENSALSRRAIINCPSRGKGPNTSGERIRTEAETRRCHADLLSIAPRGEGLIRRRENPDFRICPGGAA